MEVLNDEFDGKLSLAIEIFKGNHPRKFLNQLISSQLDIDRLDYLKRDSFYTGVAEGNVNSERLITMLNVKDNELVVEEKGIYSVEKFIISRRLMYWQVYFHKTGLISESILVKILQRAKELSLKGEKLYASQALSFFLTNKIDKKSFNNVVLETFSQLDDFDIISAIKSWQNHDDLILSTLSKSIIQRKLPKINLKNKPIDKNFIMRIKKETQAKYNISKDELAYFVLEGTVSNHAYSVDKNPILILLKNGEIKNIVETSDHFNLSALTKPVVKYYLSYPK